MSLQYIVILVDKQLPHHKERVIETATLRVQVVFKGQQMHGLRFKHTRPTLIINEIKEPTLKNHQGEEIFEKWWRQCVLPNAVNAKLVG